MTEKLLIARNGHPDKLLGESINALLILRSKAAEKGLGTIHCESREEALLEIETYTEMLQALVKIE